jgi:hypothetical protein
LQAIAEPGVEVKWVRFSDRVPAMRWTLKDGTTRTITGYTRGTVQGILGRVIQGKP